MFFLIDVDLALFKKPPEEYVEDNKSSIFKPTAAKIVGLETAIGAGIYGLGRRKINRINKMMKGTTNPQDLERYKNKLANAKTLKRIGKYGAMTGAAALAGNYVRKKFFSPPKTKD